MHKATPQAKEIQVSPIDVETQEAIKLINSFPLPGDFFHWLSGGNCKASAIEQKIIDGKFTRIGQIYVREFLLFTGRLEMKLDNFSKETIEFFVDGSKPFLSTFPELSEFKLEHKTKIFSDLHYTIISNIINNNVIIGTSWEIYELPLIIQIYSKLDDPLRYWRNN